MRTRACAALLLLASTAAGAPRRFALPGVPSLRTMSKDAAAYREPLAPRCFGFSARLHAFACLGYDKIYNTDHVGAEDQATNIRIDVVGPQQQTSWTIAAIGGRPTVRRAGVETALGALDMRPLRTRPIEIATGAWVNVGDDTLFLRVVPHDGDVSFENFGDLTLRCKRGFEVTINLRDADIELGETAWAYRSPDGGFVALGIVGVDGGEETSEYSLDTTVIDVVTTCQSEKLTMWTSKSATVAP